MSVAALEPYVLWGLEQRGGLRQAIDGTYLKCQIIGDTTTFEGGPVTMLNESERRTPSDTGGEIIEVEQRQPGERPVISLFEVRWSQLLEQGLECHGYVIGCRLSTEWIRTLARRLYRNANAENGGLIC
jgi:hypothetical protein